MNKNIETLLALVKDNPDLPIVPMVNGEIPGDDYGYWLGEWGTAYVDEYLVTNEHERVVYKRDNDVFGVLEDYLSYDEFEALPEAESECRPIYDSLPWQKAIIAYIDAAY